MEESFADDGPKTDWAEWYYALRERLWILILCFVLGGLAATYYLSRQHQAFKARSVLSFEQSQPKVFSKVQGVVEDNSVSPDAVNTIIALLQSYPFAQRVAEHLKLDKDPRFTSAPARSSSSPMTVYEAAAQLLKQVTAASRARTRLIDIEVTQSDASLAVEVANAYAEEYIAQSLDRRAAANKTANQYLVDEAERMRREMRISEEAMQSYRERERAASPEKIQEASESKLDELSKNIAEAENKIFQLDNDLNAAASAAPGDVETLLRLPSVAAEPKVAAANQALADEQHQLLLIKQTYRAKHPIYIAAETQLAALTRSRNQLLSDAVTLLRNERMRLQAQAEEFKKAQETQQGRLLSVTGKSVEYNDLKRKLETSTAMYNAILSRMTEIDVTKGITDLPIQVQEHALDAIPVNTSPIKIYVLGLAAGLAAGVGIALGLHILDHSIKTIEQAENLAGVPVLAAIPRKTKSDTRTLDVVTERKGMVAEAVRSLRTSLAMGANADDRRIFLFTSAMPSEGKTFCSCNFAATLGQQGFKTLIIDADLRKPMVSRVFFGKHRSPGLVEVLNGKIPLSEAVIPSELENVSVLATGGNTDDPTELLARQQWRDILKEALLTYDRVVLDSAPVLAVSDALLIAPHADVVCLVVRSFKTPTKTVARALKALGEIDCSPVGLVVNFLPTGAGSYYYYSGKYYGSYGEKNVYGT